MIPPPEEAFPTGEGGRYDTPAGGSLPLPGMVVGMIPCRRKPSPSGDGGRYDTPPEEAFPSGEGGPGYARAG